MSSEKPLQAQQLHSNSLFSIMLVYLTIM